MLDENIPHIPYTTKNGTQVKLYKIGVLSEQLGRTTQTVRKWEVGGVIPPTPFKVKGQRLYTEEHIESIVRSAEKSKIRQGSNISKTAFTKRIFSDFEIINEKLLGGNNNAKKQ